MGVPKKGAVKKSNVTTTKSNKVEKSIHELYGKSDIDDFMDKKNKIDLSKKPSSVNSKKKLEILPVDVSDEEVEDFDQDDDELDFDGEDFDEEDFDDDEEDDDDMGLKKGKTRKDLDLENKMAWGKDRDNFYSEQLDDEQADSQDEEEEEREAKALQEQRKKLMKEEDYNIDNSFKSVISKKASFETKRSVDPEEKILDAMNNDLSSIDYGNNQDIELLQKNLSSFSKKDKLQYLMQESPLLIQLLEEFKTKIGEIKYTLMPILEKVKQEELPTSKGISFLETKYHLLLSYCLNITYFLMLKASGSSIKDHPVIDQLVKIRTILEKIKPLDNKLQYQVEKLLKTATLGVVQQSKDDPMRFKPNLGDLADGGDDSDEETNLMREAKLYMAPQTASERSEVEASQAKKRQEREKLKLKKAASSAMSKFIQEEYGDAPEEQGEDAMEQEDDDDKEIREFEENNFVRIQQTKKDKKKEKQRKIPNGLDSLADFNDLNGILETEEDKEDKENQEYLKKKRMEALMKNLSGSKRSRSADEDIPLQDKKKRLVRAPAKDESEDEIPSDDDELDGIPRDSDYVSYDNDLAQGKRKISREINNNRGLTRYRSKEDRTPHLRNRKKFEKAIQKRNNSLSKTQRQDSNFKGVNSIPTSVKSTPYRH